MAGRRTRGLLRQVAPLFVTDLVRRRRLRGLQHEWSLVGSEWPQGLGDEGPGWDVQSVLDAYVRRWPSFLAELNSPGPLRASPESEGSSTADTEHHNATMVFAYALLISAQGRDDLRMLDWGGGIGHYLAIGRALAPRLRLEYTCRDLSLLAAHGRTLFPEARFVDDDSCLEERYEFVLASASLHYSKDWAATLRKVASATAGHLLVTRAPMVESTPSFVFSQRPSAYGTQYPGWCLNRSEFLAAAADSGLTLVREFDLGFAPVIDRAPEQNRFSGFLFKGPESRRER